ncbi:MAG: hypothetical protein ACOYD4_15335 [Solirubrobacterales bacterium]
MAGAPELKAQIEAERGGQPFLVLRDGEGEQAIITIDLGHDQGALGRPQRVRRRAARLGRGGLDPARRIEVVRGECTLVDDGLPRNGSYVNEDACTGAGAGADGDTIRFGRAAVLYRRPGEGGSEETVVAAESSAAASISPPRAGSSSPSAVLIKGATAS